MAVGVSCCLSVLAFFTAIFTLCKTILWANATQWQILPLKTGEIFYMYLDLLEETMLKHERRPHL